ncbi:MAG: Intracellular distribution of mitochondria [Ramalina farinacea]|uniref:Clustered mitochondria protein homolog n=1 Tax=Ramalina farinacea TaxID=258253 RepID=A0AA43QJE3_9LECA|nr:Intracellular distribution of mitochondria [Ramalina farinacea]
MGEPQNGHIAEAHHRSTDSPSAKKNDKETAVPDPPTLQDGEVIAGQEESKAESRPESKGGEDPGRIMADGSSDVFQITVKLPHQPYHVPIMVSTQEQVQDLRQSIMESPGAFQYSCFHLELNGQRVNDFVELADVAGLTADSEMILVEDPYTEKEARTHFIRIREIIGISGDRVDSLYGIDAGLALHDAVYPTKAPEAVNSSKETSLPTMPSPNKNALTDYNFDGSPNLHSLILPPQDPPPKSIKYLGVSSWNPPPPQLRQRGHLLYLQLVTNEGEQFQITSHVTGFYVNKSSNSKFDPFPRLPPKNAASHSLFSLISRLSISFDKAFEELLDRNNKRDPLLNFQLTNAIPASPWLVSQSTTTLSHHAPDQSRTQEAYLMSGLDGNDTMRDWNEELQSTRELPRETVQERVFRERLTSKVYAEFTDAATKGAVLVARGEVAPLNPTEARDAQIFVYNNVFYSFGADGVGTFTSEGGDEAARVAVGKDAMGVKAINQLDVAGLSTAGTVVIDYLGKRIVAQSIVPGIFRQREPEEHQVDYGGVEGRDVVAHNPAFVQTFAEVSKALKVKRHPVWDKEGKKHELEGSIETKGLLGTDGRKYILDLYRLTPLDITWLETYCKEDQESNSDSSGTKYPHRMTVLRSELVDSYWRLKMREYVKSQVEQRSKAVSNVQSDAPTEKGLSTAVTNETPADSPETSNRNSTDPEFGLEQAQTGIAEESNLHGPSHERVDISAFSFSLNPDVFCGQAPATEEDKAAWAQDEEEVRAVCTYLHQTVFRELLNDLRDGEINFPMDGSSLTQVMHQRGVNIRYLGKLARTAEDDARGLALKALAEQEMISRAFKHLAYEYLKELPAVFSASCLVHLLNCLLGSGLNQDPHVALDEDLQAIYPDANYAFLKVTPQTLISRISVEVRLRYQYFLADAWPGKIRHVQLLRSISLKLGLQLVEKHYAFSPDITNGHAHQIEPPNGVKPHPELNGISSQNGSGNKKKRKGGNAALAQASTTVPADEQVTFRPEDVANIVPMIKDSCPRSALAEEALEACKISLMQNQQELGRELLHESLTLYEQIYGILHPEVARVYHQLATLYFQLDEKAAAIELAHKAIILSERTLGVDSAETILCYLSLAHFEHGNRNTSAAVACVKHALELWNIVYGPKHPDCITTFNNAAVMLQQLHFYHQSRIWFEKSLSLSEDISGKSSVGAAALLHQLAQALFRDGDHKGAVRRMREAYSIFLAKLGPEAANTKESETWLEQLTQNAVSMEKAAKDLQARQIRRTLNGPRTTLSDVRRPATIEQALLNGTQGNGVSGIDKRSVDELLKWIEGGGDMSKPPSSKRKATNGKLKRRSRAAVGSAA